MDYFEDAMYIFSGDRSRGDILDALGNLTFVVANLNYCNFRAPFRDMINFCRLDTPAAPSGFDLQDYHSLDFDPLM